MSLISRILLIENYSFRKKIGRPVSFWAKNQKGVPDNVRTANVGEHMHTTAES